MYDFMLVLIFYNHVLSMYNFWDKLFYDNVCLELTAANQERSKSESVNIEIENKLQDLIFEYKYAHE